MEKFFHLKENGTTVSTEILAGLTTVFAMAYIIVVNPQILSQTGMPWGGVFLATIIAAIIGTLVMGLFVAYVGMLNVGLIKFTPGDPKAAAKGGAVAATPGLANFNDKVLWVFLIGLVLAIVFTVMKVKGGMLLAIAITTVIGIPFGVTT